MNEPTMETLARRVDRVERENRRRKHAKATVVTWLCLSMLLVSPALAPILVAALDLCK